MQLYVKFFEKNLIVFNFDGDGNEREIEKFNREGRR